MRSYYSQKMVKLISNTGWSHLNTSRKQFHNVSFHFFRQTYVTIKADLKAIGPIAPNWHPPWNYLLSAVQIHTTTHNTL